MNKPDLALEKLEQIYNDFGSFCRKRGAVSESDTRHKIIDRILTDVLGWPYDGIKDEEKRKAVL